MKKFNVLFVDEDKAERNKFLRYAENFNSLNIISKEPPKKLTDLIDYILESNILAVISDFDLREKNKDVTYYGDELVKRLLDIKPSFPVFIFTSYEYDALESADSVYYVYNKIMMNDKKQGFLNLVSKEIENYLNRIEKAKNEFAELKLKKINGTLNIQEEKRLLELDNFLEKSINQKTAIPEQLKGEYIDKLNEILKKTDELIEAVKKNHKPTFRCSLL